MTPLSLHLLDVGAEVVPRGGGGWGVGRGGKKGVVHRTTQVPIDPMQLVVLFTVPSVRMDLPGIVFIPLIEIAFNSSPRPLN